MGRSWFTRGTAAVRRFFATLVRRLRERGRSAAGRAIRLTGASVAAYVVAEIVGLDDPPPLIAALTAIIVVQVTLTETMTSGFQRVLSVVSGVVLALGFVSVVGLSWWSLGLLVGTSIVVGQLLRLGPQLVEAPISAMLVLGVGYAGSATTVALDRVLETLVGAAVGLLVNIVVPPAVQSRYAGEALQKLADEIAGVLEAVAAAIPNGLDPDAAKRWLEDARRLNRHVPRVDRALAHAEETRQLNIRALAERDRGVGLRDGLEALEHCSITVRSLLRSVYDGALAEARSGSGTDRPQRTPMREVQAELIGRLAEAVRAFGGMLEAEVEGSDLESEEARLARALWALRASRADATELLLRDPREQPADWDLNSDLAQAVDRLLTELDLAEHTRTREELRLARIAARQHRIPVPHLPHLPHLPPVPHVSLRPLGALLHPGRDGPDAGPGPDPDAARGSGSGGNGIAPGDGPGRDPVQESPAQESPAQESSAQESSAQESSARSNPLAP